MNRMALGLAVSLALTLSTAVGHAQETGEAPIESESSAEETTDEGGHETPEGGGIQAELETIEDLLDLIDTWDGGPDELQATYEGLKPELQAMVDENFESWALEGGIGLGAGYETQLVDEGQGRGLFSAGLSMGMTWPVGQYALPIYYAVPEIPGPWALGFNVSTRTDNFNTFGGALNLHWAYEYIGTTPFIDVGPALRYHDDLAVGVHTSVGYGNILLQGYVESEYTFDDSNTLTVIGGVRIPWLLFTLI